MTEKRILGMILKRENVIQARVDSSVSSIALVVAARVDVDSERDFVTEENISAMPVACCKVILPPIVDRKGGQMIETNIMPCSLGLYG